MQQWKKILAIFPSFFLVANGLECLCKLQPSNVYEGTMKWNCENHSLLYVPVQCFNESVVVSELILSVNIIEEILPDDFTNLIYLRSLYLDYNNIVVFHSDALEKVPNLEVFNIAHNPNLVFPINAFGNDKKLTDLYFISTHIGILPNIYENVHLSTLDARNCQITTLPRPLFGALESKDFYLNFVANKFVDVSADILLPLGNFSIINFDSYVIIWAEDEAQKMEVLDKQWRIDLNLEVSLKVCGVDGFPMQNPAMC